MKVALILLYAAQFFLLGVFLEGKRASVPWGWLLAGGLASASLWLLLARLAGLRPLRVLVALAAGFFLLFQAVYFARYGYFVDRQALQCARFNWHEVLPVLLSAIPALVLGALAISLVEYRLAALRPRALPRLALFPLALVPVALLGRMPREALPPDLRLIDGVARLFLTPAEARPRPVHLSPLPAARPSPPNVVLIISESLRADSWCSAPVPDCPFAPQVNALLPDRIALPRMRSTASFTAVSMSAIATGRPQAISEAELRATPTIFEILKAARREGPAPYTAYWSAHYLPMFVREDIPRAIDSYVGYEDLTGPEDARADVDQRLADHLLAHLPALPEPFFLVVQLYNTHIPYPFDEADAPFQPWSRSVTWSTLPQLFNAYRNSIRRQDRQLARMLRALGEDARHEHTFVLFTSDHGEEFGEHKQIHHGHAVVDEQIHVPAWVHHGAAALRAEEARALRENAGRTLTHLDIAPTVLDLFGVLDAYRIAMGGKPMPGRSLIRPITEPLAPVPLTNCAEALPCALSNWGMLGEDRKIEAVAWDPGWHCFPLGAEHGATLPLSDPGCAALVKASREWFAQLPNGKPNGD
jgi:hypothetical protein